MACDGIPLHYVVTALSGEMCGVTALKRARHRNSVCLGAVRVIKVTADISHQTFLSIIQTLKLPSHISHNSSV